MPWTPGNPGYHSGRPRDYKAIERRIDIAAKRLSTRALQVLEEAMDPGKTPGLEYKYRIAAAKEILDRAWGKPKQSIKAEITTAPSDEFAAAMQEAEARERAQKEALKKRVEALCENAPVEIGIPSLGSEEQPVDATFSALINKPVNSA